MSVSLHSTHRWNDDEVPVCLDCRAEGYEDEPAAFAPCPTSPPTKPLCWKTLQSMDTPFHIHLCELPPHDGDHICDECRRRFGTR